MEEGGEPPVGLRFPPVIYERYQKAATSTRLEPDASSDEGEAAVPTRRPSLSGGGVPGSLPRSASPGAAGTSRAAGR